MLKTTKIDKSIERSRILLMNRVNVLWDEVYQIKEAMAENDYLPSSLALRDATFQVADLIDVINLYEDAKFLITSENGEVTNEAE